MTSWFITASGTGVGKTLVTTALCWQLRQAGKKLIALKPVISGYDPRDPQSDTALILQSCGLPMGAAEAISPWRYAAPLSPNMAAAREGNPVDMAALVEFCRQKQEEYRMVEGVGGAMSALTGHHTVLDWIEALSWPVILVGGSYLGALSHTLTALEALHARGARVHALIVSESQDSPVTLTETVETLEKFVRPGLPVVQIPRLMPTDALWTKVPLLPIPD
ncbi:MAG: dethiobiotin synthase [Pseudomonadota bacterium]|nr:dethiobiotin synthase [Pseudomonadota bacterium]